MVESDDASAPLGRPLVAVTLAAAVIRTLWLFTPLTTPGDALEYRRLASWLVTRHLFSSDGITASSYRPPLYPALIAALDLLTHDPVPALFVVQVALSTLTVPLIAIVTARRFGRAAGLIAGMILALAPMTARFATTMLTETLFTFLIVAAIWAWSSGRSVSGGVALGLATLTRASTLPYMIALLIFGVAGRRTRARRDAMVLSLTALLTVAPWAVRNLVEVGHVTVADAGWGGNLFYGTVDLQKGSNRWSQLTAAQERLRAGGSRITSAAPRATDPDERGVAAFALSWIADHPIEWIRIRIRQWPWLLVDTGDYLPVTANRVSFADALATRRLSTLVIKIGFLAGNTLVLLLAAIGLWSCRTQLIETLPLWSFPVYLMLAHLPVYVEPRYGLPLVPFTAMFAAAGLTLNRAILTT